MNKYQKQLKENKSKMSNMEKKITNLSKSCQLLKLRNENLLKSKGKSFENHEETEKIDEEDIKNISEFMVKNFGLKV